MRAAMDPGSRRVGGLAWLLVASVVGAVACGPARPRSIKGEGHGTPGSGGSSGTSGSGGGGIGGGGNDAGRSNEGGGSDEGGSGNAGGEGSVPSASASPGCAAWASTYCTWLASCYEYIPGDTLDGCEARFEQTCAWTRMPGVVAPDEALEECARKQEGASCDAPLACEVARGTLEAGSSCASSHQCASGYCTSDFGSCGTCAEAPTLAEALDACENWIYDCDGLFDCVNGECRPHGEEGDPCGGERTCNAGIRPDGYLACIDGECTLKGRDGEDCYDDQGLLRCGSQSACTDSNVCVRYEEVATGAECGTFEDSVLVCGLNDGCVQDSTNSGRRHCVPFPGAGEDCRSLPGYQRCAGGMQCDENHLCAWGPVYAPAMGCNE
ncbi:MAG TPA: hypothetical protein VNN72_10485 [Polyangiaceae bacterium]|nr:hypothetical protein [Polyangiaceae bacterium]